MRRKELQIPEEAATQSAPARKTERVPVQKKKSGKARKAERASAKKKKASPVQKAADAKAAFRKRKKQYQHMMTLLRAVIRIVNAAGSTLYRK